MEFLSKDKDKLARLDEERQQRRKARADEAIKRLAEVGKTTQQMVVSHIESGGESKARPGGLSRVLFEHATGADNEQDGRSKPKRTHRDPLALHAEGRRAIGSIDHAMSTIHSAMLDATGEGMRNGLSGAARSVSDAVQRVSTLAHGVEGQHAASNNPLAELMAEEAHEQESDHKEDHTALNKKKHEHEREANDFGLGHIANDVAGTFGASGVQQETVRGLAHEVPRELAQTLGRGEVVAPGALGRETVAAVTSNILNGPRDLGSNAMSAPRESLHRAADGAHQIATNLRDAPAHAIENVTQVAEHVARNHNAGMGALNNVVPTTRDPAANAVREVGQNEFHAKQAPRDATQSVVHSVEHAREGLDPTRLAGQAANAFSQRNIVEQSENIGGVRDLARHIDPRAVAEHTTSVVEPRNLLRTSVNPGRLMDGKATVAQTPNTSKQAAQSAVNAPKVDAKLDGARDTQAPVAANIPTGQHRDATESATTVGPLPGAAPGAIVKPAAEHSSTVIAERGNRRGEPPPAAPPTPGPTSLARSSLAARERETPAAHIQPSRDRTTSDVAPGGQAIVNLQPVLDDAPPVIDRKQSPIQQPAFTIEMRGEAGGLPALPRPHEAPRIHQPPVSTLAPPAVTNLPTTSTRAVPALPSTPPSAVTPTNPALAAGREAIGNFAVPKGAIAPIPPSPSGVASGAPPKTAIAAHPGPGEIHTAAAPTHAPLHIALPSTQIAPVPSSPKTPNPEMPAPLIPGARLPPGHDKIPDPASVVQGNVSLSADRTATSSAIHVEAQSQSEASPMAMALRESMIGPLRSHIDLAGHSADGPMATTGAAWLQHGASAVAAARSREEQELARAQQEIATHLHGAEAERAQFAGMPPPSILHETSAASMQPLIGSGQAAVHSVAGSVTGAPVQLDPAVVARSTGATVVPSTLPPFDLERFEKIDQHAPVPTLAKAPVETAQAAAALSYEGARRRIQNIENVPAPIINVPANPNLAKLTSGGQPTREAAIARIENEIALQTNAQAAAQMRSAATPIQSHLAGHVASSEQLARSQVDAQVGAAESQVQDISGKAPPISGAEAAAAARPEHATHQAAAHTSHEEMKARIADAHHAAETTTSIARETRDQQIHAAQTAYHNDVQNHVPAYSATHEAANAQFQVDHQTAQQTLAAEQTQAQINAKAEADQAKAKADADIASHHTVLERQRQQAITSHVQQAQYSTQLHNASMQQQQAQMDSQVQQYQSEMHSQVAGAQALGQADVDHHLSEGEHGYRTQIEQGEHAARNEKERAERQADRKQAEADDEKRKSAGGVFGGVVGWVKDRVSDLARAVTSVLVAARDMVVSLMEKARQAAVAVLERARQAAIAAMQKAKSAIQGVISACASAMRSVIKQVAAHIKSLIANLATVLRGLVAALTSMLSRLVAAYQAAMNAVMDGLVTAAAFANKDLGDKLRTSTQKYRDGFNQALSGLKNRVDAAGTSLQENIQRSATGAIAAVDSAEHSLNDSVLRAEQGMNASVESTYHQGVTAINTSFDAAETGVNKAFGLAETGVKGYFDLQIGAVSVVQHGIAAIADFAIETADHVMTAIDMIAQAAVSLIPDSWKKAFVDFWNGPWRSTVVIGLATVAAVAITAATLGAGAPVAAILMASVIGGSIAGTAYFGGEIAAREGEIALSTNEHGMHVRGFGDVQVGKDGKPIPPPNLTPDQKVEFDKQSQWAMSNFKLNHDQNGQVTGYDRKDPSAVTNDATKEGIKGFGEGAISAGLAATGGTLGGAATKALQLAAEAPLTSAVEGGISNVLTGPVNTALTKAFDTGFGEMQKGKGAGEAFKSALNEGRGAISNRRDWASVILTFGVTPAKLKLISNPIAHGLEGKVGKAATELAVDTAEVVTDTMTMTLGAVGGAFMGAYDDAKKKGMTDDQARAQARKAAAHEFSPEVIVATLASNVASAIAADKAEAHGPPAHAAAPAAGHS